MITAVPIPAELAARPPARVPGQTTWPTSTIAAHIATHASQIQSHVDVRRAGFGSGVCMPTVWRDIFDQAEGSAHAMDKFRNGR